MQNSTKPIFRKKDALPVAGLSRKGSERPRNDDRFLIRLLKETGLLVAVSDGMGGHRGGDLAAETVIACLDTFEETGAEVNKALTVAVHQANASIREMINETPSLEGMGATVTAVVVSAYRAAWIHVGDSRLYLIRDGILHQITRDHSFLQDLIDGGDISSAEALKHPMSHVLDQCVGSLDAGPDSGEFRVVQGDTLLICTDGVYRLISETEIVEIATTAPTPTDQVNRLLDAAQEKDTGDDATVVAVKII